MMESEADHLSVWESDQGDRKSMIVQMSHGHTVPLHCVQVPAAPALTSRDELALLYQDRTVPPKAPTVLPGSLLSSVGAGTRTYTTHPAAGLHAHIALGTSADTEGLSWPIRDVSPAPRSFHTSPSSPITCVF